MKIFRVLCGLFTLLPIFLSAEKPFFLPSIREFTFDGKVIDTKSLKGKLVYVQFINSKSQDQISLLKNIYNDFIIEHTIFPIIFVDNLNIFLSNLGNFPNQLYIIDANYVTYKSLFLVPPCCEARLLFDKDSKLLFKLSEFNDYEQVIRPLINSRLYNLNLFSSSRFGIEGHSIFEFPWLFGFINNIELKSFRLIVISFHTNICLSCPSGMIIKYLNELKNKANDIYIASIVSSDFKASDIENLKQHLNINYNVFRDDGYLPKNPVEIISKNGRSYLGNLIYVINNSGIIMKIFCCSSYYIDELIAYITKFQEGL